MKVTFCSPIQAQMAKMPAFFLPFCSPHESDDWKGHKTQCTFHLVFLASVSLNSMFNKSEWQPGSLVAVYGFLPLLFYPPECLCHARLHLDTLRKYWLQPSLALLAAENADVTQKAFDRQRRTGCDRSQCWLKQATHFCNMILWHDNTALKTGKTFRLRKQMKVSIKRCRRASFQLIVLELSVLLFLTFSYRL